MNKYKDDKIYPDFCVLFFVDVLIAEHLYRTNDDHFTTWLLKFYILMNMSSFGCASSTEVVITAKVITAKGINAVHMCCCVLIA